MSSARSICSPAASRNCASRIPSPGSDSDKPMSATSGQTSSRSPSASAARQFSLRMLQGSLRVLEDLTGSRPRWSERATPTGRALCVLRTSARPTSATGSSCAPWPTTTRQDAASSGRLGRAPGSHPGMTLTDAAKLVDWPTPAARDHKGDGGPALDYNARPLNEVARWATPRAWDSDGGPHEKDGKRGLSLTTQVVIHGLTPPPSSAATGNGGSYRLNWRFSEWLIGLPRDWLAGPLWHLPSRAVSQGCAPSATRSVPARPTSRLARSTRS